MGRTKYRRIGRDLVVKDRGSPGTTEASVTKFADESPGPVASMLWANDMLAYDAEGELRINKKGVEREARILNETVVNTREIPRDQFERYAVESTGLTRKRAVNAGDREIGARATAVLVAARAAGVQLTPAQKRILNPLSEGKFSRTVYGKKGEFEEGTLKNRLGIKQKNGKSTRTREQEARAQELRDQLRDYRYGDRASLRNA